MVLYASNFHCHFSNHGFREKTQRPRQICALSKGAWFYMPRISRAIFLTMVFAKNRKKRSNKGEFAFCGKVPGFICLGFPGPFFQLWFSRKIGKNAATKVNLPFAERCPVLYASDFQGHFFNHGFREKSEKMPQQR